MTKQKDIDGLEMQLRALGRRLEQPLSPQAISAARQAARVALQEQSAYQIGLENRRLFAKLAAMLLLTLPLPILFLWLDWTTVSRVFDWLFPGTLSQYFSYGYLWVKVCSLAVIYGLGIPALLWAGAHSLQVRRESAAQFPGANAA